MLGGFNENGKVSKSVFTISLSALLLSCQPQSLRAKVKGVALLFTGTSKGWRQLADTPVTFPTCASLHGQLLAVGGMDLDNKETTAIYTYNTTANSWKITNDMVVPRYRCLVAVLPHDRLMVVGGYTMFGKTDIIEFPDIAYYA